MAITREFPWQYQGICFGKTRDFYLTEYSTELKDWYALASYLEEQGTVNPPESRKTEAARWNPLALLSNPGPATLAALGALLLAALAVLVVLLVRHHRRKASRRSRRT